MMMSLSSIRQVYVYKPGMSAAGFAETGIYMQYRPVYNVGQIYMSDTKNQIVIGCILQDLCMVTYIIHEWRCVLKVL